MAVTSILGPFGIAFGAFYIGRFVAMGRPINSAVEPWGDIMLRRCAAHSEAGAFTQA